MEPLFHPEPAKPPGFDRRLAELTKNVRVVWNKGLGVWQVEELGRVTRTWRYVMLWAIVNPPVPPKFVGLPAPEKIMEKLHEIDCDRLGRTPMQQWGALCAEMDEKRKDALAKHFAEIDEAGREYAADMAKRFDGIRHTYGAGTTGRADYGFGSPNMRKFMNDKIEARRRRAPIRPHNGHS